MTVSIKSGQIAMIFLQIKTASEMTIRMSVQQPIRSEAVLVYFRFLELYLGSSVDNTAWTVDSAASKLS